MTRITLACSLSAVAALLISGSACGGDDRLKYEVAVTFNDTFTQRAAGEVEAIILAIDEDAELRLQESFPPVLRGTVRSYRRDVCDELLGQLSRRPDVANLACADDADDEEA
jgi:hypothetical protein